MSGIVGLLGVGGGAAGTQFAAPTSANIVNPTNPAQLAAANTATQNTMAGQQGLLSALQGQGGLQNQSNVFNQMQGTAGQYQNIANGTGPNPAMAQLAQTTGQNVAQTGALMAGQRGAGANVGLMARQAGQQGAATQQQAVGQGATLAAQQQLAGLSGLQAQQQNMAGVAAGQVANQVGQTNANTQAAQAQQANLMGAQAGVNTANVGMQSNINTNNAQLANTQMQGQQALIGGLMSAASGAGGMMGAEGGDVPEDMSSSGGSGGDFGDFKGSSDMGGNASINASVPSFGTDAGAAALAKGAAGPGGGGGGGGSSGGGGGASSMLPMLMAMMAGGGEASLGVDTTMPTLSAAPVAPVGNSASTPQSSFGKFLKSGGKNLGQNAKVNTSGASVDNGQSALYQGAKDLGGAGMKAMAPTSATAGAATDPSTMNAGSGETQMPSYAATGGLAASGGKVAAKNARQKATHPGDNYSNDKIPAMLSEHEIVIPRKVTMGKDPVNDAAKFVAAIVAKRRGGR